MARKEIRTTPIKQSTEQVYFIDWTVEIATKTDLPATKPEDEPISSTSGQMTAAPEADRLNIT